jgi:TolB protein
MDFDGFNLRRLTSHQGIAISPSFSPDNSKILYSLIDSKKRIKNVSLYELDLNSNASRLLIDTTGMNSGAVYASDGKGIYLTQSYGGNADVYYIDSLTKASRKVTNHSAEDVDPSIRADGNVMTFLSNRAGRANIYTIDPKSTESNVKRISYVGKFNATPRFSPDGTEIVFSSWVDNGFDIYRIGVDGNNLVRLTKNYGSNEDPTFSSDGEFIVFTSRKVFSRSKAEQRIYIMTKDGEILGPLSNSLENCYSPRFSN